MIKIIFSLSFSLVFTLNIAAQKTINLYNPNANAVKDIDSLLIKAKAENKQILVQVGGNWCSWCIKMHQFIEANGDLKRLIKMDYLLYKLNYSKENTNELLMAKYKHPERFGFPVFLVIDKDGNLIHTQDSSLLEEKDGYSKTKVFDFIKNWTANAVAGK
jgi:thioredoxin-related protein